MNPFAIFSGVRRQETPFVALMFAHFFLVISVFWVLKPLKKGQFLNHYRELDFQLFAWVLNGPQAEMVAKVMNMFIVFVTGAVLRRFGVRIALLVMPVVVITVSAGFIALPVLVVGCAMNVIDSGLNYSLNQSARESLYTPLTRREKYAAKAFIDMFIQRFGKALSVGVTLYIAMTFDEFHELRWLSLMVLGITAVWVLAALRAGRGFDRRAEALRRESLPGGTTAPG